MTDGGPLIDQLILLGIALTRSAAAFALMPVFSKQVVPPMVRNSIAVAFGVIVLALQPQAGTLAMTPLALSTLFLREAFIGIIIGFFFGGVIWAFESAGQIIDSKIGPAAMLLTDPMSSEQTTLHGAVIGRLASFVFMTAGGLGLVVRLILSSYMIWPISPTAPHLNLLDAGIFQDEFVRIVMLALGFAAPALVILTALEGGMGLINRFVPEFNVFTTSLAIKSWLAGCIVLATLGLMVDTVVRETVAGGPTVLGLLRRLAGP